MIEEEKFFKPKQKEEVLKEAIESLEDATFKFACFVDMFKTYMKKEEDGRNKRT